MYLFCKRIFDVVLSIVAIIMTSPAMIIIAALIKIESEGPFLFLQKRVGVGGKHFNIFKFRSMRIGAPNVATDKLGNPSKYVTNCGRFIRKTSLDELPQLFNILFGHMSFVGPRPALYNQFELVALRNKHKINQLKPGLTGYAQIMGRDMISDEEKVSLDKYYLEKRSFLLDMKIMVKTTYKVAMRENVQT